MERGAGTCSGFVKSRPPLVTALEGGTPELKARVSSPWSKLFCRACPDEEAYGSRGAWDVGIAGGGGGTSSS